MGPSRENLTDPFDPGPARSGVGRDETGRDGTATAELAQGVRGTDKVRWSAALPIQLGTEFPSFVPVQMMVVSHWELSAVLRVPVVLG